MQHDTQAAPYPSNPRNSIGIPIIHCQLGKKPLDPTDHERRDDLPSARTRSVSYLSIAILLRRLGELIVQIFIASKFGAGYETDAFFAAMMIPGIVIAVLTTTLRQTFLPTFIEQRTLKSERDAWMLASSLSNALVITISLIVALGIISRKIWIELFFRGLDPGTQSLAASLTVVLLPAIILNVPIALYETIAYSYEHFLGAAMAAVGRITVYVSLALMLGAFLGIQGIAIAVISGYIANIILLLWVLRGKRRHFVLDIQTRGTEYGRFMRYWSSILLLSLLFRFSILIERYFGSLAGEGAITQLALSSTIISTIVLLVSHNIATVVFPDIAESASKRDHAAIASLAVKSISFSAFITTPIWAILMAIRFPVVRLLLERGSFSPIDTYYVANILLLSSGLVIGPIITSTTSSILYSLQSVRFLYFQAGSIFLIQFAIAALLFPIISVFAIPLASSIAFIVGAALHLVYLCRHIDGFLFFLKSKYKGFAGIIGSGIVTLIILTEAWKALGESLTDGNPALLARVCILVIAGASAYLASAKVMRVPEMQYIPEACLKVCRWLASFLGNLEGKCRA